VTTPYTTVTWNVVKGEMMLSNDVDETLWEKNLEMVRFDL